MEYATLIYFPFLHHIASVLPQHGDPSMTQQIVYRFEEIPRDELDLASDELLVPVSHFFKDVYSVFGIPFFIRIKQGESYGKLKERIQKRLSVPDKEWEKVSKYSWSISFEKSHLLS